jgi:hypothetical protein
MSIKKTLTKDQAEDLANSLLANEPRFKDSAIANAVPVLKQLAESSRKDPYGFSFAKSSAVRRYFVFGWR